LPAGTGGRPSHPVHGIRISTGKVFHILNNDLEYFLQMRSCSSRLCFGWTGVGSVRGARLFGQSGDADAFHASALQSNRLCAVRPAGAAQTHRPLGKDFGKIIMGVAVNFLLADWEALRPAHGCYCTDQLRSAKMISEHKMLERNRLLSRAISNGESAMRHVLRDLQSRREQMQNALRYRGKQFRSDQALAARQQICELDRLITYATLALSNLPQERVARARAISDAIDIMLKLGVD
jgi:hypothetical protein